MWINLRFEEKNVKNKMQRGGPVVGRKAHNLETLVQFQSPQQLTFFNRSWLFGYNKTK